MACLNLSVRRICKGVSIHRTCELRRRIARHIRIGDDVAIGRNVWINIAELPEDDEPVIIIEDGCKFSPGSIISAKNRIHIGRNVIFGPSVFPTDHNHAYDDVARPIGLQGTTKGGTLRVEEGAWIGFGAAIVCNEGQIVIGRNSVVGANSMVTGSVAAHSIIIGNPPSDRQALRLVKACMGFRRAGTKGRNKIPRHKSTVPICRGRRHLLCFIFLPRSGPNNGSAGAQYFRTSGLPRTPDRPVGEFPFL